MNPLKTIWTFVVFLTIVSARQAESDTFHDSSLLEGLRQRRLFELAETHCQNRLARSDLSDAHRARLVIELIRTCAEHTLHAFPDQRRLIWQQAETAIDEHEKQYADDPQLLLIRVQFALGKLALGEVARVEAEWAVDFNQNLRAARTQLRISIQNLERLRSDVEIEIRRDRSVSGGLSKYELMSLARNIQFQLARALRQQALTYAEGSPDRINSLTQVVQQLRPLVELPNSNPLTSHCTLDLITAHRLLGEYAAAYDHLSNLTERSTTPAIRLGIRAEQIRLALAEADRGEMLRLLDSQRTEQGVVNAELDLARVEAFVALFKEASAENSVTAISRWQQHALDAIRLIGLVHGTYWARRAERALTSAAATGNGPNNLELLIRTAHDHIRRGHHDEALSMLDMATHKARDAGATDREFQLAYTAARFQYDRSRHSEALVRFRQLAHQMNGHPNVAKAHWAAIMCTSELVRSDPDRSTHWTTTYHNLLEEHLNKWPGGHETHRVRWWLGNLLAHRGELAQAVTLFREITTQSEHHTASVSRLAECWPDWIDELHNAGDHHQRDQQATNAENFFYNIINSGEDPISLQWSPADRDVALALGRIVLNHRPGEFEKVTTVLQSARKGNPRPTNKWDGDALTLLIVLQTAQGKLNTAQKLVRQLKTTSIAQYLLILERLEKIPESSDPAVRRQRAELQLAIIQSINSQEKTLRQNDQLAIQKYHASALRDAGHRDKAAKIYRHLAGKYPRDIFIQQQYGEFLSASTDRETLLLALAHWRHVVRYLKPKTDAWYQAKFLIAEAHYLRGDHQRAADIIRLLKALPSGLKNTPWNHAFNELLRKCNQPTLHHQGARM